MIVVDNFTSDTSRDIPLEPGTKYVVDFVLGASHMTTISNETDVDEAGTIVWKDVRDIAIGDTNADTQLELRLKKEG